MISFSKQIGKNYAIDIALFYLVRSFEDGITFYEFEVDLSWYKGDHNPKFEITWVFLNFMLFNLNIYNVHHVKDESVSTDNDA